MESAAPSELPIYGPLDLPEAVDVGPADGLTLETAIDRMRTIDQAKSVLAQRLKITEHHALQRLRKESRDQRRPMHELAQILLDADKLFKNGTSHDRLGMKTNAILGDTRGSVCSFEADESTL